jgi:hypothetical protein
MKQIHLSNRVEEQVGLLYIHSVHAGRYYALIQVHFQINGMYYFEEYSEYSYELRNIHIHMVEKMNYLKGCYC